MFGFSTTVDEVIAGVDLTGKTVVVTGAASGLGLQTVTTLVNAGAEVVAAVRDPAVLSELAEGVHPVPLDLASLEDVRAASALIAARHPAIDILINNAGVMFTPHGTTADGYRRYGDEGITALAVHPGTCQTNLGRYMDRATVKTLYEMGPETFAPENIKSLPQAAATTVWAATAPVLAGHGGVYLADCQVAEAAPSATDPATAHRLWQLSQEWANP